MLVALVVLVPPGASLVSHDATTVSSAASVGELTPPRVAAAAYAPLPSAMATISVGISLRTLPLAFTAMHRPSFRHWNAVGKRSPVAGSRSRRRRSRLGRGDARGSRT